MTANERIMKICAANPATLARIDAILSGEDTTAPERDVDLRTCTITAAARRFRISRPTMYRMIKSGRIKVMRLNGVNRVLVQSLVDCALANKR